MINKTIFFLHKGVFVPDSRSHIGLSHSISTAGKKLSVKAGEDLHIPLKVSNTGTARWLDENINDIGVVKIGTHLYDEQNTLLDLDFSRHAINGPIEPGQTFEQDMVLRFSDVGKLAISVDLVAEGVCWFEGAGSRPLYLQIHVI